MVKRKLLKDLLWLYFGLFLFAVGILLGVKANIGYAPWGSVLYGTFPTNWT